MSLWLLRPRGPDVILSYGHLWCRSQISGQPTFVITRLRSGSYRKCRLPYPFFGCWNFLPNNNCDVTLVNLIFILVISSKTTSYINLIFQSGSVDNLTIFMAFVSIKAHNLHIKNFRSLRPVWCLINANQKSWEKFHRLSVCVVMLCFTYSRVQLQQNGKIVTIWCNLHCFFFISHRWGNILIEDLLDIYIFVQIIVFRRFWFLLTWDFSFFRLKWWPSQLIHSFSWSW